MQESAHLRVNRVDAIEEGSELRIVGAEPAPQGIEFTYAVRAQGRLVTPEEFGQVVIRANPDGSLVRLKDVARIELGTESYGIESYLDGKPAVAIAIMQAPGSNALRLSDDVKAAMQDMASAFEDMGARVIGTAPPARGE